MDGIGRLSGRRVLVLEDEFLIRLDICAELESEGAETVEAGTVAEGLAQAARPVDAAVLDITLPDGESWPVAEALRERAVPVVIHSAHAAEAAKRLPGTPVLSKPAPDGALTRLLADAAVSDEA